MESKSTFVTILGVIAALPVPLAALAVAYGLLTQEEAELWVALAVALIGSLGGLAPLFIARNYNDNRAALVAEAMRIGNVESIRYF